MRELRLHGPPGTGKSTSLARKWIPRAVEAFGSDKVVVVSLTRTAAAELTSRDLPLPRENVGTLHALGYRAIGRPTVAEGKHLQAWNAEHPHWRMAGVPGFHDDEGDAAHAQDLDGGFVPAEEHDGTRLLGLASLYCARDVPVESWPVSLQPFWRAWSEYLEEHELVDFNGMISRPIESTVCAPGNPRVLIVDEAQDCSALDLKLVRHWAAQCDYMLLAGDGDQSIFGFRGGSIRAFLGGDVAEDDNWKLTQSYRVPRAVHAAASKWIARATVRYAVDYAPRDADGRVSVDDEVFSRHADALPRAIERTLKDCRTAMILAPCAYQLRSTVRALREAGVLFHNPYRVTNGAWNPLRGGFDRLRAFVLPVSPKITGADALRLWTWRELWRWIEPLNSRVLLTGAKKTVRELATRSTGSDRIPDQEILRRHVFPDATMGELKAAVLAGPGRLVAWHRTNLLKSWQDRMAYAYQVAGETGTQLVEEPRVVVGTVHSVKGGEADAVYLFPELSARGRLIWAEGGERADEIRRMFYVAMTRARERLIVCRGRPGYCVQLPGA